jgi:hypothetical protein
MGLERLTNKCHPIAQPRRSLNIASHDAYHRFTSPSGWFNVLLPGEFTIVGIGLQIVHRLFVAR